MSLLKTYTDQLGREIHHVGSFQRIISLVPSQTELLYDLGLGDRVVGITKFCIHPDEWFRSKQRVGGTKQLDMDKIKALNPDLIIANKEENEESQIRQLMERYSVWISDIKDLDGSLDMIRRIGILVEKDEEAETICLEINSGFNRLRKKAKRTQTALYFIWKDPDMIAGQETFITAMVAECGFVNLAPEGSRYPEYAATEALNPDLVLLSSEPYPFREKHISYFASRFPGARIIPVDGEMFSWYGSRLCKAPAYFAKLIQSLL